LTREDIEQTIRKYALQNAVKYGGKARVEAVFGKIFHEYPDLKERMKEIRELVKTVVREVNQMPESRQREALEKIWPESLVVKSKIEEKFFPPLPNVEKYEYVHTRFCPNPDGALHLGSIRAAILCDEYTRMYNGRLTLRFDDSDPRVKSPIPEAYDWIRVDLKWLDVKWDDEVYQSDRMEIYYGYAEDLLKMGLAYICTCKPEDFRVKVNAKKSCPCRGISPEENLERWKRMLDGSFGEGEAVVRIKTDLAHPNPAVRDWPALRIVDTRKYPHPRTGKRYRVWPLFAFCCGIDDYELKISHVIRGKEHLTSMARQLYLYKYFGWTYPDFIHYGRLKLTRSVLSKSKIREGIKVGLFSGWDDPRLGTIMALRRRGFIPKTIRDIILDVGPKPVDITLSWENICSYSRKNLDPIANRYFVIVDPITLTVSGVKKPFVSEPPLHPEYPERGRRNLTVQPEKDRAEILLSRSDLETLKSRKLVRLMDLFNISISEIGQKGVLAEFHSEPYSIAKELDMPLLHWLPESGNLRVRVVMPTAEVVEGFAEKALMNEDVDSIIQMERFGFGRVDSKMNGDISICYAHR